MYDYCFSKSIHGIFVEAHTIHHCFRKLDEQFTCGYVYLHCLENLGPTLLRPFLKILGSIFDKYNLNGKRGKGMHLLNMLEHENVMSGTKREWLIIKKEG